MPLGLNYPLINSGVSQASSGEVTVEIAVHEDFCVKRTVPWTTD